MTKVKSIRDCRIAKNGFSYTFIKDEVKDVDKEHLNVLLDTGLIEEVSKTEVKE